MQKCIAEVNALLHEANVSAHMMAKSVGEHYRVAPITVRKSLAGAMPMSYDTYVALNETMLRHGFKLSYTPIDFYRDKGAELCLSK